MATSATNAAEADAVLVVEDDPDLVEIMRFLFEDAGATFISARSLDEVKALGDRVNRCALALLDVNLGPKQPTGVDVSAWLKEHHFGGRIVFLTGHANATFRGVLAPGTTLLSKPVDSSVLLGLLPRGPRAVPPGEVAR